MPRDFRAVLFQRVISQEGDIHQQRRRHVSHRRALGILVGEMDESINKCNEAPQKKHGHAQFDVHPQHVAVQAPVARFFQHFQHGGYPACSDAQISRTDGIIVLHVAVQPLPPHQIDTEALAQIEPQS